MPQDGGNLWLAKALWNVGAIQLGDYTLGRTTQHSPVYVNLRLLIRGKQLGLSDEFISQQMVA